MQYIVTNQDETVLGYAFSYEQLVHLIGKLSGQYVGTQEQVDEGCRIEGGWCVNYEQGGEPVDLYVNFHSPRCGTLFPSTDLDSAEEYGGDPEEGDEPTSEHLRLTVFLHGSGYREAGDDYTLEDDGTIVFHTYEALIAAASFLNGN